MKSTKDKTLKGVDEMEIKAFTNSENTESKLRQELFNREIYIRLEKTTQNSKTVHEIYREGPRIIIDTLIVEGTYRQTKTSKLRIYAEDTCEKCPALDITAKKVAKLTNMGFVATVREPYKLEIERRDSMNAVEIIFDIMKDSGGIFKRHKITRRELKRLDMSDFDNIRGLLTVYIENGFTCRVKKTVRWQKIKGGARTSEAHIRSLSEINPEIVNCIAFVNTFACEKK